MLGIFDEKQRELCHYVGVSKEGSSQSPWRDQIRLGIVDHGKEFGVILSKVGSQ